MIDTIFGIQNVKTAIFAPDQYFLVLGKERLPAMLCATAVDNSGRTPSRMESTSASTSCTG